MIYTQTVLESAWAMLPDLPVLKRDLQRVLDHYLRTQVDQRLGIFNEAPKHMMHEGNRIRTVRADGSIEESQLKESLGEMSLKFEDISRLTLKERLAKLNDVADEMARQIAEHLIGTLSHGLDRTGQVVDGKGKPFDVESVFAALEKIQIDFDETGKPELTILIPPALTPRAEEVLQALRSDTGLQRRYDEIMMKKWEEWRDREAARKLVG